MIAVASRAHAWRQRALCMAWMIFWCAGVAGSAPQVLEPITLLSGTVLDPAGKPVAGARVGVRHSAAVDTFAWDHPQVRLWVITDKSGKFELRLPRLIGPVMLEARRAGFLRGRSARLALDVPARRVGPLQLAPGLTLSGRVLDVERRAVAGALITATALQVLPDARGTRHRVQSGSERDGRFVLRGLDVAEYEVRAVLGSAVWSARHLVNVEPKSRSLDITLQTGEFMTGMVSDAAGLPLPGARVLEISLGAEEAVRTDARGRFRLGPFVDEMRGLQVALAGYAPFSMPLKAPPSGDVLVVLERAAVLRGRAVDAATQVPVRQFDVRLAICSTRSEIPTPYLERDALRSRQFTSPDGSFEWGEVPTGPWCLQARAPGYQGLELADVEFLPGAVREVTLEMQRGRTLRGRVIDQASRKVLQGAEIGFFSNNFATAQSARSDTTGAFTLEGVPRQAGTIGAKLAGYVLLREQLVNAEQSFIEIALRKGARIDGQLFAADGTTPARGVAGMAGAWQGFTDDQGRFTFSNLEPGRYEIWGLGRTARTETKEIFLSEGQAVTVKLVLDAGATIRGTVAGLPPQELERVLILAHPAEALDAVPYWKPVGMPGVPGRVQAAKDGTYRMPGLAPGPTILSAGTGDERHIRRRVEVPASGELAVDFNFAQDTQVTGRVTRDGQAVAGHRVRALPQDGQEIVATVVTSPQGDYVLSGLARGYYNVAPEGAAPARLLIGGRVVQDFELPALAIAGRVVDAATGAPLQGVTLQLLTAAGGGAAAGDAKTNQRGEFSLDGLNAASYVLSVHRAGYDAVSQRIELSASAQDLPIAMQPAEGIAVRILDARGLPPFSILVTPLSGRQAFAPLRLPLDTQGIARVPPALTGSTLVLTASGHESVTVPGWKGKPLEITLREQARR